MVSLSASGRTKEYAQVWFLHFFEKAEMDCLRVHSTEGFLSTIMNESNIPEEEFLCQESLCSINLFFPKVRTLPLRCNKKVNQQAGLSWENVRLARFSRYETPHNNKDTQCAYPQSISPVSQEKDVLTNEQLEEVTLL